MKTISLANPFGGPVYHEETLSSTMDAARDLAAEGAPHGTVIGADFQEAGRGRTRGRPWLGNAGDNLFCTILLRYSSFAAIPPALTLRTGLAVSLAIESFAPPLAGLVRIKWPNDVLIQGGGRARKAAGILAESDGSTVFIGIGVNVFQTEFPLELRHKAVSIAQALLDGAPRGGTPLPAKMVDPPDSPAGEGLPRQSCSSSRPGDRVSLLGLILLRLYRELHGKAGHAGAGNNDDAISNDVAITSDGGPWRQRLEERLYMKGERVRFAAGGADSGQIVEGLLRGIGPGGELRILPSGAVEEQVFVTGELDVYG